jgi:hypothetical protein
MRAFAKAIGLSACLFVIAGGAQAFELDGAWVTNETTCNKVFANRGGRTVLTKDADLYGSGFVIDRNLIRGKVVTCAIKARKEDGGIHYLVAACSNDVALQNVQFSYKPEGDNKITRFFSALPGLDTSYYRCPLQAGVR